MVSEKCDFDWGDLASSPLDSPIWIENQKAEDPHGKQFFRLLFCRVKDALKSLVDRAAGWEN